VKTDAVHFLYTLAALTILVALQDLAPAFGGVKPIAALTFVLHAACLPPQDAREDRSAKGRLRACLPTVLTAFLAGGLLDALSDLPFGCTIGFALFVAFLTRGVHGLQRDLPPALFGALAAMLAATGYETWLYLWGVTASDGLLLLRALTSALMAAPLGAALFGFLPFVERHIGLRKEVA